MLLVSGAVTGLKKITHLDNAFHNATAILMGGAPSIKEQPLHLLEQRGVLSCAINNAARHFQPVLWFSGDHPGSFEPQIIEDPRIMKFAPFPYANNELRGRKYWERPNTHFYLQDSSVPFGDFLLTGRKMVPWYANTMFVSFHILYVLGVRRIILGGSDFEPSGDKMYAHDVELNSQERDMNVRLYKKLEDEIRSCKTLFEKAGLEIMDCSVNSKLRETYPHVTMEEAVALCRENFPEDMKDPKELLHGTRFASQKMRDKLKLIGTSADELERKELDVPELDIDIDCSEVEFDQDLI